jgi:uncharacterized protein YciI
MVWIVAASLYNPEEERNQFTKSHPAYLKSIRLWHIDPLLSGDSVNNSSYYAIGE